MPNQGPFSANTINSTELSNATLLQSGTNAARPAASSANLGMEYWDTDNLELQRSNGTTWDVVIDSDAGAAVSSLRTLGSGSAQAAAGTHSH